MPRAVATSRAFGYAAVSSKRAKIVASFAPRSNRPRRKPCSSKDVRTWKDVIVLEFLKRPTFLRALSSPTGELQTILDEIFASRTDLRLPCDADRYVVFAIDALRSYQELGGTSLEQAIAARLSIERAVRLEMRGARENVTLYKDPEAQVAPFVFAQLFATRLPDKEQYPPPGFFVACTRRVARIWEQDLEKARLTDRRNQPRGIHILDPDQLQMSIPGDLSRVVHDSTTGELVLVVVRSFCSNEAILAGVALAGSRALACRRNVRCSDPGSIAQVGFTAGSRNELAFGLARNFASRAKGAAAAERASNEELAAALSYFWVRVKALFPEEVVEDIATFFAANGIPHFDPNWPHSATTTAELAFTLAGTSFSIPDIDRAPGCAVVAEGYARPVHFEPQPHRWAVGWNYCRQGASLIGGHFYLSAYGIEMRAAQDTAWSWMPTLFHTTGLSNAHPSTLGSQKFRLEGFAFVTPIRLATAYAKWARDTTAPRGELLARAYKALDAAARRSEEDITYSVD